jgi:hypothetical protein
MSQDVSKFVKGFDWNYVSWKDKEYLSNMYKDLINSKSVRASGVPFSTMFPYAEDFALFNDERAKNAYKEQFYYTGEQSSHLLFPHPKGRKYWLVWSYDKN